MRLRTKTAGLVTHATPNGRAKLSEREILHKKYLNGTISKEELRKYVNFLMIEKSLKTPKTKTTITVKFGGKSIELTIEEYNKYYKPAYGSI